MGDRGVGDFIDNKGGPALFEQVKPCLEEAQLAFVNLECPISDKGVRNGVKEYTFRATTGLTEGLVSAGIDVVSLANNHVLDYGQTALLDTIQRLDDAGVAHAGAGKNIAEAAAPVIMATPAGTVAVLAASEIVPGGFAATAQQPGTNAAVPNYEKLITAIKAAAKRTDFVIVSMHWGTEYTNTPNAGQRELAHEMIDAGADLIIGHHPHVIQGMEVYKDRLIAYSLGDFVFDRHSRRETGEAFVLQVTLAHKGAPYVEVVPVYLDEATGVPSRATGEEADAILGRLAKLSSGLGLRLLQTGGTAWLPNIPASPYTTWF
jgi:poly-gamma-glutamate synthesis protein (capsule biosynthesis protein)